MEFNVELWQKFSQMSNSDKNEFIKSKFKVELINSKYKFELVDKSKNVLITYNKSMYPSESMVLELVYNYIKDNLNNE